MEAFNIPTRAMKPPYNPPAQSLVISSLGQQEIFLLVNIRPDKEIHNILIGEDSFSPGFQGPSTPAMYFLFEKRHRRPSEKKPDGWANEIQKGKKKKEGRKKKREGKKRNAPLILSALARLALSYSQAMTLLGVFGQE